MAVVVAEAGGEGWSRPAFFGTSEVSGYANASVRNEVSLGESTTAQCKDSNQDQKYFFHLFW